MAMVGIGESGGWHFLRLETFQFVVDQCPICRFLGGRGSRLLCGGNVSIPYKHVAQFPLNKNTQMWSVSLIFFRVKIFFEPYSERGRPPAQLFDYVCVIHVK